MPQVRILSPRCQQKPVSDWILSRTPKAAFLLSGESAPNLRRTQTLNTHVINVAFAGVRGMLMARRRGYSDSPPHGVTPRSMQSSEPIWADLATACSALSIGESRLRELKATGELKPGIHWVALTGRNRGPVGWDITAIAEWQRQVTVRLSNELKAKAAAIETYQEGN